MELKDCVRRFMEDERISFEDEELDALTLLVETEIVEAQATGDLSKVNLRWTNLFQTFLIGHLPLEALDPYLDHLSALFPSIRECFALGDKYAKSFLALPVNVSSIFPKESERKENNAPAIVRKLPGCK